MSVRGDQQAIEGGAVRPRAVDEAMTVLAEAHRSAAAQPRDQATADFVAGALAGELPLDSLRAEATARGLDLTRRYRAIRAAVAEPARAEALVEELSSSDGEVKGVFCADRGGLAGFTSVEPGPGQGGDVPLAVGPEVPLEHLPGSDRIAVRVLAAASKFSLPGVHDLQNTGLLVAVLESGDVGDALLGRYLAPLAAVQNRDELLASLRVWLEAGRRIDPAAERLHVHPNTLRHRLSRYEDLTGADLAMTEEIVGLWWALQREAVSPAG